MAKKESADKAIKDIRRKTRRRFSAEERIRIVMEGIRGEDSVAELCRREKKQNRQARAENTFYRYKQYFGSALRARDPMAQRTEVMTACNLLNWMSSLGAPHSEKRAA